MTTLENTLRQALEQKKILLMTHLVLGYPSLETNREVIRQMVENGVDLIEMQIPFSEPVADGRISHPLPFHDLLQYSFQVWAPGIHRAGL